MADLSSYSAIYIRTSGNDTTGNGTVSSPYATVQKGWDIAIATASGNYVLDIGVGSFSGINIAQDWPTRIAVRGAGNSQSSLGGINGTGANTVYGTNEEGNGIIVSEALPGFNISIISNNSINLGNITSNGGEGLSSPYGHTSWSNGGGGTIVLLDCYCNNISNNAGNGAQSIDAASAGSMTLTNCTINNISSNGGESALAGNGSNGGSITLTNCIVSNISAIGGSNNSNNGPNGGGVTLINSTTNTIDCYGGGGDYGGAGGSVSITNSTTGNINCGPGWGGMGNYGGGTVTFSGSSIIPNIIYAATVVSTNLNKGRGVNGSNILGLI